MKKIIVIPLLIMVVTASAQTSKEDRLNRLMPLKHVKQMMPIHKNFDVLKIMSGYSWVPGGPSDSKFSHSFQFQFLKPRPYLRRKYVSLTIGGVVGFKKTNFSGTKLLFSNNELEGLTSSGIESGYSKQRTGYFGFTAMSVVRISHSFTLLSGAALQYNTFGRYKEYFVEKEPPTSYVNKHSLNRFSLPLQFQLSFSPNQFLSPGIFYSHDLRPMYKGEASRKLKQRQFGVSFALII